MSQERADSFILERYRYVLSQKQHLNSASLQILTVYQTGLAVVVSGQFGILAATGSSLDVGLARAGSIALLFLMYIISIFSLLLLMSGISAWLSYREEEAEIERQILTVSRRHPRWQDAVSWFETYFGLAIILIAAAYTAVCIFWVLPQM